MEMDFLIQGIIEQGTDCYDKCDEDYLVHRRLCNKPEQVCCHEKVQGKDELLHIRAFS